MMMRMPLFDGQGFAVTVENAALLLLLLLHETQMHTQMQYFHRRMTSIH
jgi:hypothetical protein